jgi:hypothetical protein
MRVTQMIAWALAGLSVAGCDAAFTAGGVATVTPMFATITARDLKDLGRDELLSVELDGAYPTVFEFDNRDGALDFQRIEITAPGAEPVSMHLWLARKAATTGLDLAPRFRLANDSTAASMGLAEPDDPAESECGIKMVEVDALVVVLFARSSC